MLTLFQFYKVFFFNYEIQKSDINFPIKKIIKIVLFQTKVIVLYYFILIYCKHLK